MPYASGQSGTLPHAEACLRPYTKSINTQPYMTNPTIVASFYTCLEMLRLDSEELHAWWCNLLYCVDGEPNYRAWDEFNLSILENDLIYNV